MKQTCKFLIVLASCATSTLTVGQTPLEKYAKAREKNTSQIETHLVSDQEMTVSKERPLIIKSPSEKAPFNVYMFTKIFETEDYIAFVGLSDDPFRPNLVTTDKNQTQIDKLQLLGNYGEERTDFKAIEEAKIVSESEIVLTAKLSTWSLDSNGQRVIKSERIETRVAKYRINTKGQFEKDTP